jgi:hypothetical protein
MDQMAAGDKAHFFFESFFLSALAPLLVFFCLLPAGTTRRSSCVSASSSSYSEILNFAHKFLTTNFLTGGATAAQARQFLSKKVMALYPLRRALIMLLLIT